MTVAPWRAAALPIIKDLVVDRSAFDRIEAGGCIPVPTGSAPEANATRIPKDVAEAAMDAAAWIGYAAARPNRAAQLLAGARLTHLNLAPQGRPGGWSRAERMVEAMERCFGSCTNHGECDAVCPKQISIKGIAFLNREIRKASFAGGRLGGQSR